MFHILASSLSIVTLMLYVSGVAVYVFAQNDQSVTALVSVVTGRNGRPKKVFGWQVVLGAGSCLCHVSDIFCSVSSGSNSTVECECFTSEYSDDS